MYDQNKTNIRDAKLFFYDITYFWRKFQTNYNRMHNITRICT
jgi:hypothetical protein